MHNGVIKQGQNAALIKDDGSVKKGRIASFGFEGLQRVEIEQASAGDLVAVAGFDDVNIEETIAYARMNRQLCLRSRWMNPPCR